MCVPDDRPARDQECKVMEAGLAPRVGTRFVRLVEEQLRPQGAIGPVVEWPGRACVEPFAQPEDRHETVEVLLGCREIRNADPHVVDEPWFGQEGTHGVVYPAGE